MLRLDGRQSPCSVFLKAPAFGDVSLAASFRGEKSEGVMAVGFVIGATDSATYTFVHFDARSAILCHSEAERPWSEVRRTGKGAWWLAVGLSVGLAFVSKYTAVFLGLGILLWIVLVPELHH